jgi:hypothetical protein
LPHASQDDAIEGPFTEPQWSSAEPSSCGGVAGEHAPLVGTHTLICEPLVDVTVSQDWSCAQALADEQGVPQ